MPWKKLKSSLRELFMDLLRRALESSEGRQLLADTLPELLAAAPRVEPELWSRIPREYPELGIAQRSSGNASREDVVFITARFRSGSTLLWNLFRQLPDCTAYYEPLNERRWFDPYTRGSRVDASHQQISDYWREYEGLAELGAVFDTRWNERQLYMDAGYSDPKMLAYLKGLIDHAAGRPVLQFNRVDFRLPWLRENFPLARIVHLVRNPRASWFSSLMSSEPCPREISITEFARYDELYLLHWVRDLGYYFPVLRDRAITHPYQLFYCLWKLSYAFGIAYSDYHLTYESLVAEPERQIADLLAALNMPVDDVSQLASLVKPGRADAWRDYAEEEWFRRQEAVCEQLLLAYYPVEQRSRKLDQELVSPTP